MSENRRIDNTRTVTFKSDYSKKGKVLYKKGSTHYIHKDTVEKLGLSKVADVKEFDLKGEIAKAKKALKIKD